MPTIDVRKQTGNPPAPSDTTNAMGIGYDTSSKNLRVNDGTTSHVVGGVAAFEALTAAKTLTMADSGKKFTLGTAGGFAVTLPAIADAAGFQAEFHVKVAPTTAYTIVTGNSAEQKLAGLVFSGAGADEDSETDFTGTTITFVANTAVIGDWCRVWCDGAGWYTTSFCNATGGVTVTG